MSNAIAQNATDLAVSGQTEQAFDFQDSVKRAAFRSAKGITRGRQMLNRQKLISAVCADYRMHFSAIHEKGGNVKRNEHLPTEIHTRICKEVDTYLETQLCGVHVGNVISQRKAFYHSEKNMAVTERVHNVGENQLTLEEQHLGVNLFINAAEKKLRDLQAKPTPDYDAEKECKARIMKLTATRSFIESAQKVNAAEDKKSE